MWLNHSLPYMLRSHNTNEPSASFELASLQFFAAVHSSVPETLPFSFLIFFKAFAAFFLFPLRVTIIILFNTNVRWINWYVFAHNRIKYVLLSSFGLCRFCCPPAGGSNSTEIHLNISETYKKQTNLLSIIFIIILLRNVLHSCCLHLLSEEGFDSVWGFSNVCLWMAWVKAG